MKNVTPCPYCKGEVEVVKLGQKKTEKTDVYRITCLHCKKTVARGLKFEIETLAQGKKRIKEYEEFIKNKFSTPGSEQIRRKTKPSNEYGDYGYYYPEEMR